MNNSTNVIDAFFKNGKEFKNKSGVAIRMINKVFIVTCVLKQISDENDVYELHDEVFGVNKFIELYKVHSLKDLELLKISSLWDRYLAQEAKVIFTDRYNSTLCFKKTGNNTFIYNFDIKINKEINRILSREEQFKEFVEENNDKLQPLYCKNRIRKITYGLEGLLVCIFLMIGISCKKLVNIPPPSYAIAENNVYTNDATAASVLTAMFSGMNGLPFQGNGSISIYTALSSDELSLFSGAVNKTQLAYFRNELSAVVAPVAGSEHWNPLYNTIFKCNAAIEGLMADKAINLTPAVRQQLLGEAKLMRAFCYFQLVNLFGDVPLALTTDAKVNMLLPRFSIAKVYDQIIVDLEDAKLLLSENYLNETLLVTTSERVRPTKWAAVALLARAYLYAGNYLAAEDQATSVINNVSLYNLVKLNSVFLKNSREAIWQIQPIALSFNTLDAQIFVITSSGLNGTRPYYISNQLLNSFEFGDQRAKVKNWIDSINVQGTAIKFPYKYKINLSNTSINATTGTTNMTEYYMVLRLAEQYLIRAEARVLQNNIAGARNDLDSIRIRAGLPKTTFNDKANLYNAILHERQVELFTEWGHRWFDLKRTGKLEEVMKLVTPMKASGASWRSYQQLYPIPQADLNKAPYLMQNDGYN
jgi:starch-binding outer membrane protein, SusD/RagB family